MRKTKIALLTCLMPLFYLAAHAGELSYTMLDKLNVYEKPSSDSRVIATLDIGTAVSYEGIDRDEMKISIKGGQEGYVFGVSALDRAGLFYDFNNDGKKEHLLVGFNKNEPGKGNGRAVIVKDGKAIASLDFDTIEDPYGRKRDFGGHKITAGIIKGKGFTPPVTLISVNFDTDYEMMYGSSYLVWYGNKLSNGFIKTGCYDPVETFTCNAVFPADKGGKPNQVTVTQKLEYEGTEEPDMYDYEGDYVRTVVYKWESGVFRMAKDEKKITVPKEIKLKQNSEE